MTPSTRLHALRGNVSYTGMHAPSFERLVFKLLMPVVDPIAPDAEPDDSALTFDLQDLSEPCRSPRSPSGQCQYSEYNNFRRCIHCGRESGI